MATWNITNCTYVNRVSGVEDKQKIIVSVDWKCTANNNGIMEGHVAIPTINLNNFTSWEELTESSIIEWVKDILADEVQNIEQRAYNKNAQKGLPWAS